MYHIMLQHDYYVAYFKHQAENHPDLLHSDAVGSRVFQVVSVDEAMGDFRTGAKEKATIMRLLNYTYVISDRGQTEVRKYLQGGFIIASYYSNKAGGTDAYLAALAKSEKIADEIIEKMIADSKAGHPLFHRSLDSRQQITVSPVTDTGDGTYTGWLVLFDFYEYWRNCITSEDAPAWLDDGVTPTELIPEP